MATLVHYTGHSSVMGGACVCQAPGTHGPSGFPPEPSALILSSTRKNSPQTPFLCQVTDDVPPQLEPLHQHRASVTKTSPTPGGAPSGLAAEAACMDCPSWTLCPRCSPTGPPGPPTLWPLGYATLGPPTVLPVVSQDLSLKQVRKPLTCTSPKTHLHIHIT